MHKYFIFNCCLICGEKENIQPSDRPPESTKRQEDMSYKKYFEVFSVEICYPIQKYAGKRLTYLETFIVN